MADIKKMPSSVIHNVILEGRGKLSVSGVQDMDSFDDGSLLLFTEMGALEIKGINFHLNKLNLDTGEIILEGEIESIIYVDESSSKSKSGFFNRLFK